jgi:5-methylcytosine-specific restriction endonuclease McrA
MTRHDYDDSPLQVLYGDDLIPIRTPRQRYASWAASTQGLEAKAHMYRRQLGICLCCGLPISMGQAEIDHYIPLKECSDPLDESNMYVVCRPCNRKKGARKANYKFQVG